MAASSAYSGDPSLQVVNITQQKKVLADVLETIVQLKTEFFENHEVITDDSVILQRFCAKFEHLLQMGIKGKTSLLGRKKDYWDYFCECLGSSKGSNEGIKYVKSLGENKTSVGRGRAFIRFCLVHQRLADAIQQCLVHEKTGMWFLPGSIFLNGREASPLINALYDMNSMQFDLAPRGYDLDSAWPSFANRKHVNSGNWSLPINSRRSSITSMDTLSQISVSLADNSEVEKLAKDLEEVQSVKDNLIGQIDVLQQEKTQASQSAWATQGELRAVQDQLTQLQSKHSDLQERYHDLDLNYTHLKMERDHIEKLRLDEMKNLKDEEGKRVQQLKEEEMIWKAEMKEENERRKKEIEKLRVELEKKTAEEEARGGEILDHWSCLQDLMAKFNAEPVPGSFPQSLSCLEKHFMSLEESVKSMKETERELKQHQDQILSLENLLKQRSQEMEDSSKKEEDTSIQISSLKKDLQSERDTIKQIESQLQESKESCRKKEDECSRANERLEEVIKNKDKLEGDIVEIKNQRDDLLTQLKEKEKDLKELNQTVKENLPVFAQNLEESKAELAKSSLQVSEKEKEISDRQERIKALEGDIQGHLKTIEDRNSEILKLKDESEKGKFESDSILKEKNMEISKMRQELAGMESKLTILIHESEETENEKLALHQKLSVATESLESTKLQLAEVGNKLSDREDKLLKVTEDLNHSEEELQTEKTNMETKSKSLSAEVESLIKAVENLKADKKTNDEEKETLNSDLKSSRVELECIRKELQAEKSQKVLLLQSADGVKKSEGEKSEQIASLSVQVEGLKHENALLEGQIKQVQTELAHEVEEKSSANSEMNSLKTELEKEIDAKSKLETAHKSKIESLTLKQEELMKQINEGATRALESYTDLLNNKEESPETNNIERTTKLQMDESDLLVRVTEVFDKFSHLCTIHMNEERESEETMCNLSEELQSITTERDLLLSQTDAALGDAQQIKSQLTETSEQLAIAYSNLEIMTKENSSLHSKYSHLNNEMSRIEKEKGDLLSEIVSLKEACRKAEDEAQQKLSEKRDIEEELEEVSSRLMTVLDEKLELDNVVGSLQSQTGFSTKVLEESLMESKNALEAALEKKMKLEGQIVQLKAQIEQANVTVKEVRDENDKFKEEIESFKLSTPSESDRSIELEELKRKLEQEREEHNSAVELLNEQISALEFELSAEQMANENRSQTHESSEETQAKLEELTSVVENLKEEKSQLEKQLQKEEGSQISKASELQKQVYSQETKISQLSEKLSEAEEQLKMVTETKDKVSLDLAQLRFSFTSKMEAKENEIQTLRSDNAQFRKKVKQLIRDKDNLWQKTDQLVDEQKRKASERWQDNSTASKCPLCKAEFSLFLRKHHCRKCGMIFCFSCSDFWLDTPHSSKKSRVCQQCFNRDKEGVEAASPAVFLTQHDSGSEEEEENQSKKPSTMSVNDRTSLSSGSLPSRESSIMREDAYSQSIGNDESRAENALCVYDDKKGPQSFTGSEISDHVGNPEDSSETAAVAASESVQENRDSNSPNDGEDDDEKLYQMVTEEEVLTSITEYDSPHQLLNVPDNMTLSMLLSADDLETGKVNRQNEVWIKPGKMFAVPVKINEEGTTLCWEFSSQPKDVVFAIYFRVSIEAENAEEIVAPCKCSAHKQVFKGELTAKQCGIYNLVFDNTYSRLTSKKVHYQLEYRKGVPG